MPLSVAKRLKAERKAAQLSQKELAKIAKCSQTAIADIERGRTLESKQIPEIAAALGVNALWLKEGKLPKTPTTQPLNDPIQDVVTRMQTLSEQEQYRVARMIHALTEPEGNDPDNPTSSFGGEFGAQC